MPVCLRQIVFEIIGARHNILRRINKDTNRSRANFVMHPRSKPSNQTKSQTRIFALLPSFPIICMIGRISADFQIDS